MSEMPVLILNAGSSSLKYQLVVPETAAVQAKGIVERIGEASSPITDHAAALQAMKEVFAAAGVDLDTVGLRAVGHRVVHGGPDFSDPTIIDDEVLEEIKDLIPLAPLHNPGAVSGIEAAREEFDVPHVAIFDTAFFSTLLPAAATYAIPRDLAQNHRIKRYGFSGQPVFDRCGGRSMERHINTCRERRRSWSVVILARWIRLCCIWGMAARHQLYAAVWPSRPRWS